MQRLNHLLYTDDINPLNDQLNPTCHLLALLGAHHILHVSRISVKGHFNPLNAQLNPTCHLTALLEAHHILHVSRLRVKGHFNPLNAQLNPICHLTALLEAHHILHVNRIRVKGHFNPLNAQLNPTCHLTALLGAHHILHISRIRVKLHVATNNQLQEFLRVTQTFSRDIEMVFGIEKCKTLYIAKGRMEMRNFTTEDGDTVGAMSEDGMYRHLGHVQAKHIKRA
jgi:hypothetical protein